MASRSQCTTACAKNSKANPDRFADALDVLALQRELSTWKVGKTQVVLLNCRTTTISWPERDDSFSEYIRTCMNMACTGPGEAAAAPALLTFADDFDDVDTTQPPPGIHPAFADMPWVLHTYRATVGSTGEHVMVAVAHLLQADWMRIRSTPSVDGLRIIWWLPDLDRGEPDNDTLLAAEAPSTRPYIWGTEPLKLFASYSNLCTLAFGTRGGKVVLRAGVSAPGYVPLGQNLFPASVTTADGREFPVDVCPGWFDGFTARTDGFRMTRPLAPGLAIGAAGPNGGLRTLGGFMRDKDDGGVVGVTAGHLGWNGDGLIGAIAQPSREAMEYAFYAKAFQEEDPFSKLNRLVPLYHASATAYFRLRKKAGEFEDFVAEHGETSVGTVLRGMCTNVMHGGIQAGVDCAVVRLGTDLEPLDASIPKTVVTLEDLFADPRPLLTKLGAVTGRTFGAILPGQEGMVVRDITSAGGVLTLLQVKLVPGGNLFAVPGDSGAFVYQCDEDDMPTHLVGTQSAMNGSTALVSLACSWMSHLRLSFL